MVNQEEHNESFPSDFSTESFDYSFVHTPARIAVYDDLKAAPRIIEIPPSTTAEFIEALASKIDEQRRILGGQIPYAVIREVTENFIHAKFSEVVVSVLDGGNTIRFCDQGPGIPDKTQALLPGFTSAVEPMKHYIRGVGSGLPIVKDYLDYSQGHITIEDNMGNGAVVTISLVDKSEKQQPSVPMPPLNQREKDAISLFSTEGALGNKDISDLLNIPPSSAAAVLKKLEEYGLIERSFNAKRILTDLGSAVSQQI